MPERKGLFITLEGIEHCGKSTQIKKLQQYLQEKGYQVEYSREPGGTKVGNQIRGVLLNPNNAAAGEIDGLTELFLFETARSAFSRTIVQPALEKGSILLSDRYYDSSIAYQGFMRGIDLDIVNTLNRIASRGCVPDLTFVLDLSVQEAFKRGGNNEFVDGHDRIEGEPLEKHEKVRQGYLWLVKHEPERVRHIYAQKTTEEVHEDIVKHAEKLIAEKGKNLARVEKK